MLLSDIFSYLSYGELSQYELGTSNSGVIGESDYPKVTSFINRGLTQLHTKLPLRLEQLLVQADYFQSRYILSTKYAASNTASEEKNKYILDSANPYTGNLTKIEQVINSDREELVLNDSANENTVFTPMPNVIQFAIPTSGLFAVTYRANHGALSMARGVDPSTVDVEITDSLLEPLLTFVGSKIIGSKGGTEGIQLGMAMMQSFKAQIAELEAQGLFNVDMRSQQRIWSDKWV